LFTYREEQKNLKRERKTIQRVNKINPTTIKTSHSFVIMPFTPFTTRQNDFLQILNQTTKNLSPLSGNTTAEGNSSSAINVNSESTQLQLWLCFAEWDHLGSSTASRW
jgi:hypothetical protein